MVKLEQIWGGAQFQNFFFGFRAQSILNKLQILKIKHTPKFLIFIHISKNMIFLYLLMTNKEPYYFEKLT